MNSDRVNPMVIKELRQGLKSRVFLGMFMGLQGMMVLSMFIFLSTASVSGHGGGMEAADGIFWFMLGLLLLVLMPLRSFQALYEEIRGDTLELLFLTRMDAWRIAFGKWCALVLQILLLVSAVLPYLVLRYFLGAVDVAGNLAMLFYQVLISMLLVSVGVGLSAWSSRILRGMIIVGALFSLYTVPWMIFAFVDAGSLSFGSDGWMAFFAGILTAGILMMIFVEYGASQIAPPAENHALRKRILALLLTAVLGAYAVLWEKDAGPLLICMLMLVPIGVDALCEPLVGIPSVYLRLRKLGMFRWLFTPGWVGGFLFVSLLFPLQLLLYFTMDSDIDVWKTGLTAYNTLMLPFVLIRLFPALARRALASYLALQGLFLAFCLLMVFLEEIRFIANYIVLGHLFPMMGFFVIMNDDISNLHSPMLLFPTGFIICATLMAASRPLRQMRILSEGKCL